METPQVFSRELIDRAYAAWRSAGSRSPTTPRPSSNSSHPVALLENAHPNPKLTTPADLAYLEFLLARADTERTPRARLSHESPHRPRLRHPPHRRGPAARARRREIRHDFGLEGHSDADA
jgi:hypothetical protein